MSLLLVEDTSPSVCHVSFPWCTCCFFYLRFFHCFKRLCIYVMVSDGEIVGNMFKENLDSVVSFDIFCCYEKQHVFPTCSYHFPTKVGAFYLGFPPNLPPNLPQGCCYFWAAEVRNDQKAAILEQQNYVELKKHVHQKLFFSVLDVLVISFLYMFWGVMFWGMFC